MNSGPLTGLRVLDASTLYAGPLLAALLADHGADVVTVEPPGGHPFRATRFWPLTARGKRSVTIDADADDPGSRARLHGLVAAADVVVVNEPAARLARRGLDPPTLLTVHPALVVAQVSAYGADGPYADRAGNGTLAEAFTGFTDATRGPEGTPVLPGVLLGDSVMAWAGAFGVLAAVHAVRSGAAPGRVVDVNPVDAMLHVVGAPVTDSPAARSAGTRLPGVALRGVFATADGRWVALSVLTERQRSTLADLAGAPGAEGTALESAVTDWISHLPGDEVIRRAVAARLPAAPVNDADDAAGDPHLVARGAFGNARTPDGRDVLIPTPAPRTTERRPPGRRRCQARASTPQRCWRSGPRGAPDQAWRPRQAN